MTTTPLTVLFLPESAYGPTNQCIGLGDLLTKRGHRVVFASESSWKGQLKPFGFEEALVDLAEPEPDAGEEDAGKFWTDFIAETAPEFRKPTIEQLESFVQPTYQALIDGAKYAEPRLREIIAEVRPDVIVEDNVVCFPALRTGGMPFVRIVSCNPLEMRDPSLAPVFSGLPEADSGQWDTFLAEFERTHRPMWEDFNAWVVEQGADPLPELEFMHSENAANLYVFPEEADYDGHWRQDGDWHRIDSSVRKTDDEYELPAEFANRPDGSAIGYLSLGSLGGADVELMRRLIDVLGRTRHRFIVSLGPQADLLELPANMVGAQTLPQTKVIPQVDLVITHGGNNTTTECLHFGKPMVLLPLFWDQYDNAQRMDELGFGTRLATYEFTDAELTNAVDTLFADKELLASMDALGERIRGRDGLRAGADVIEQVARDHRGVNVVVIDSVQPAGRDVTVGHGRLTEVASAALAEGSRVVIVRDDEDRYFAAPVVGGRRAEPGEGAAEALVRCVVEESDLGSGFALSRWDGWVCTGETGVTVDQTNESVIVGGSAVVKWSIEVAPGAHPAPQRLATLVAAGFAGIPRPWGALTWQRSPQEAPRLVATISEYVADARDGWEWAVADVRTALTSGSDAGVRTAATRLGTLIGELHAALSTAGCDELTSDAADRFASDAHAELDEAIRLTAGAEGRRLRYRADRLHTLVDDLRRAGGSTLIDVHGDLHVGQVLRADDRYAVIDFDGNPVLEPAERLDRQPAATDVAGMLQSLDNVGHVVVRRTEGADPVAVSRLTATARETFLDAYGGALAERGLSGLLDESMLVPLRIRQICREYLYAAKHLSRWLYVPDAAVIGLDD